VYQSHTGRPDWALVPAKPAQRLNTTNQPIQGKKPALVGLIITRHVNNISSPGQEPSCCYKNSPILLQQQTLADIFQIFCTCFSTYSCPNLLEDFIPFTQVRYLAIFWAIVYIKTFISSLYKVRLNTNINLLTDRGFLQSSPLLRYSLKLCKCSYLFILPFLLRLLVAWHLIYSLWRCNIKKYTDNCNVITVVYSRLNL
jgi:hypothetical protein